MSSPAPPEAMIGFMSGTAGEERRALYLEFCEYMKAAGATEWREAWKAFMDARPAKVSETSSVDSPAPAIVRRQVRDKPFTRVIRVTDGS